MDRRSSPKRPTVGFAKVGRNPATICVSFGLPLLRSGNSLEDRLRYPVADASHGQLSVSIGPGMKQGKLTNRVVNELTCPANSTSGSSRSCRRNRRS